MTTYRAGVRAGALLTVAACCLAMSGCGGKSNLPPIVKVQGKVTLQGQPVTCGSIEFCPDRNKGNDGPMAFGSIGPDGTYTVTTQDGKGGTLKGAVKGFHRVCIKPAPPRPGSNVTPVKIPAKYTRMETSDLTVELKEGDDSPKDFDLKP